MALYASLGVAHHKVSNVLGNPNCPNLGDHAGALAEMQRSVAVFERASARYPDNAMFKRNRQWRAATPPTS